MVKGKHPKKEIRKALDQAREAGLEVVPTAVGHRWGYIRCPHCRALPFSVWSTPSVPEWHVRDIRRYVAEHREEKG